MYSYPYLFGNIPVCAMENWKLCKDLYYIASTLNLLKNLPL